VGKSRGQGKPNGELRQSQILTTFGPGAMVDLPTHSVVIAGLKYWHGDQNYISEERLRYKVNRCLDPSGERLLDVKLRTPPQKSNDPQASHTGIDAFIFPTWFVGQVDKTIEVNGKVYRTRPLVKYGAVKTGLKIDGQRVEAVPVRFVQACTNGHLSDIDWYAFVYRSQNKPRHHQLWLDEGGSGNDFEEIFVRCAETGDRRPLSEAKVPESKVLGKCHGYRPWLGVDGKEDCHAHKLNGAGETISTDQPEYNRLLVRSASNAHFPQLLSVISIPDPQSDLKRVVERFYEDDLRYAEDIGEIRKELKKHKFIDLLPHGAEAVWEEVQRLKAGEMPPDKSIKQVELEAMLACQVELGHETLNPDLSFQGYARDLSQLEDKWSPFIDRIVLVHRLREVSALVGFTRFEAAVPNIEGEIDDLAINLRRASLDFEPKWVPAIENLGEGVFIGIKPETIDCWLQKPQVRAREAQLKQGYIKWLKSRGQSEEKADQFPGAAYLMLHSLSHLLITAVSLDCGYASSAIRERIYAFQGLGYGILLHTGTSGSEGTLGGLVDVGRKVEIYLARALEYGRLCSNDPVCAQHDPADEQEDRLLHGAACHGCLLIAETSCERRNEMLDRALVVQTVESNGAEFFPATQF
jgi:hypothetical protein